MSSTVNGMRDGTRAMDAYNDMMKRARDVIAANKSPPTVLLKRRPHGTTQKSLYRSAPASTKSTITAAIEEAQRNLLSEDLKKQALDAYVARESAKVLAELRTEIEEELKVQLRRELPAQLAEEFRNNTAFVNQIREEVKQELRETLKEEVRTEIFSKDAERVTVPGEKGAVSSDSANSPSMRGLQVDASENTEGKNEDEPLEKRLRPRKGPGRKRGFSEAVEDDSNEPQDVIALKYKKVLTDTHLGDHGTTHKQGNENEQAEDREEKEISPDGLAKFGTYAKYNEATDSEEHNDGSEYSGDRARSKEADEDEAQNGLEDAENEDGEPIDDENEGRYEIQDDEEEDEDEDEDEDKDEDEDEYGQLDDEYEGADQYSDDQYEEGEEDDEYDEDNEPTGTNSQETEVIDLLSD